MDVQRRSKGKRKRSSPSDTTRRGTPSGISDNIQRTRSSSKNGRKGKSRKRQRTKEEAALEQFLFGEDLEAGHTHIERLGTEPETLVRASLARQGQAEAESDADRDGGEGGEESLFFEDRSGDAATTVAAAVPTAAPAWVDEDDDNVIVDIAAVNRLRKLRKHKDERFVTGVGYQKRLRDTFNSLNADASWAEMKDEDEGDLGRSTSSLLANARKTLPQGELQVVRLKDANLSAVSKAVVQSVKFHSAGQIMLTAGMDKTLRFFRVDGVQNPKVQSVFFRDMPIQSAMFSSETEVVCSGRRPFFYSYDLEHGVATRIPRIAGRSEKSLETCVASPDRKYLAFLGTRGTIIIVSNSSKQWVANLKLNGTVAAAAFSSDSASIFAVGGHGEVYVFDMRQMRCTARHVDEGCLHGSALATSGDGRFYATGSDSGIVNFYATHALEKMRATSVRGSLDPVGRATTLTTPIHDILFSPDSQIAAVCSNRKKDALRMVHVPSFTTFPNWPTGQTPLHVVSAMAFSPNGGYFAVGNSRGRVLLYRLKHYTRV